MLIKPVKQVCKRCTKVLQKMISSSIISDGSVSTMLKEVIVRTSIILTIKILIVIITVIIIIIMIMKIITIITPRLIFIHYNANTGGNNIQCNFNVFGNLSRNPTVFGKLANDKSQEKNPLTLA